MPHSFSSLNFAFLTACLSLHGASALPQALQPRRLSPRDNPPACVEVAKAVKAAVDAGFSDTSSVQVDIQDAWECLNGVPLNSDDALKTVDAAQRIIPFQSTAGYTERYGFSLSDQVAFIGKSISDGKLTGEFEFEAWMARTFEGMHDGHCKWEGAFSKLFKWRRSPSAALISLSVDGVKPPDVYLVADVGPAMQKHQSISSLRPVRKIDGKDVVASLMDGAPTGEYLDENAPFNTMFTIPNIGQGHFLAPIYYPGPETRIQRDGDTQEQVFKNNALVTGPSEAWMRVLDGASMYDEFVKDNIPTGGPFKRETHFRDEDSHLEAWTPARSFRSSSVVERQSSIDLPSASHSRPMHELASRASSGDVWHRVGRDPSGALFIYLRVSTFKKDKAEFSEALSSFWGDLGKYQAARLIVDLRANPGGTWELSRLLFAYIFTDRTPKGPGYNFRLNAAMQAMGSVYEAQASLEQQKGRPLGDLEFVVGNLNSKILLPSGEYAKDWADLTRPDYHEGDQFSQPFAFKQSSQTAKAPLQYNPSNVLLFTDGDCGSACAHFVDIVTKEVPGVKTITIGGKPVGGPSSLASGTRGAGYGELSSFAAASDIFIDNAWILPDSDQFAVLPVLPPISMHSAGVNMMNEFRQDDVDRVPLQFDTVKDKSHCRIFYTLEMMDPGNLRPFVIAVFNVAFGGANGDWDWSKCAQGSIVKEQWAATAT